jgi:CRISPR-associated protein Cas2
MPYLICYDITDDRLRGRVAKSLLAVGLTRLQYSVFGGDMQKNDYLAWEIEAQKDFTNFASPSDSILVFDLTEAQVRDCKVIGHDALNRAELTGEQHTLIL